MVNTVAIEDPEETLPSITRSVRQLKYAFETMEEPDTAALEQLAEVVRQDRVYAEGIGAALTTLAADFSSHNHDELYYRKEEIDERLFSGQWSDIENKPTSFPSTWDTVSGKPETFASSWDAVTGKPTAFPSEWDLVTNKPDLAATPAIVLLLDQLEGNNTITTPERDAVEALL